MTDGESFSDELLNAYVDDELMTEEKGRIERAMAQDSELRERIRELERLKRLVQSAYADEAPRPAKIPRRRNWIAVGVAASLAAFALGGALTWGLLIYTGAEPFARIASAPEADRGAAVSAQRGVKVVFHLNRNDPERLDEMLNEAEAILMTQARRGESASVRIIATGAGLSLFKRDSAGPAARVSTLKRRYEEQLVFNGCGLAYKQLKARDADGQPQLVPELELVDVGVLELMRRQRQGWAYIRL